MSKSGRPVNSDPLYYRLYVTYFEASKAMIKTVNKEAFYRLSISNDYNIIA